MTIAVVDQQLGRDGPHTGGRRHVQRRGHVLDDGRGGTAQHLHLVTFGRWRARPALAGRRWARRAVAGRGRGRRAAPVAGCRRRARPAAGPRAVRPASRSAGMSPVGFGVVVDQKLMPARDRPRRGRRGTCGTSPRPAIRSARMVNYVLLTAAVRLDSSVVQGLSAVARRLPLRAPRCRGIPPAAAPTRFRPIKANPSPQQIPPGGRARSAGHARAV